MHSIVCIARTKWDNLCKTPCAALAHNKTSNNGSYYYYCTGILICWVIMHIYGIQVITEWNILFCVNPFDYKNSNAIIHLHYVLLFMKHL